MLTGILNRLAKIDALDSRFSLKSEGTLTPFDLGHFQPPFISLIHDHY
jgi:hypothetical protein